MGAEVNPSPVATMMSRSKPPQHLRGMCCHLPGSASRAPPPPAGCACPQARARGPRKSRPGVQTLSHRHVRPGDVPPDRSKPQAVSGLGAGGGARWRAVVGKVGAGGIAMPDAAFGRRRGAGPVGGCVRGTGRGGEG